MTAQTVTQPADAPAPAQRTMPPGRAGYRHALASEWTKIRTVRSTVWTLACTVVLSIGISVLANWGPADHPDQHGHIDLPSDLTRQALAGIILGQLAMVVFGAMSVTAEYSTGMIRTSLAVQPRRMSVFLAKLTVVTLVALVVGEVTSFASFLIDMHFWTAIGHPLSLSTPGALAAVVGGGLYLAGAALLAYGLGALIRHTAGAITAGVFLVFVVSILVNFMPQSWQNHIDKWLPAAAGSEVWATQHVPGQDLGAWTGFLVFMIYGVVATILGAITFTRRDA